jgi:tetratricopeptide (TPR) repeat protein
LVALHSISDPPVTLAESMLLETKLTEQAASPANSLVAEGEALLAIKQFRKALALADRAIEVEPANIQAWKLKADSLSGLGKYKEAYNALENMLRLSQPIAVEIDEINSLMTERSRVLETIRRNQDLLETYDQALESKCSDARTSLFAAVTDACKEQLKVVVPSSEPLF